MRRFWLWVIVLGLAAGAANAQIALTRTDFDALTPEVTVEMEAQLRYLSQAVLQFNQWPAIEQEVWTGRIVAQYDASGVPLDTTLVNTLYSPFERNEAGLPPESWGIAHEAFQTLMRVDPNSDRLDRAANVVMQSSLPTQVISIPHINLIAGAMVTLLKRGGDENIARVLAAEDRTYWQSRAAHCTAIPGTPTIAESLRLKTLGVIVANRADLAESLLPDILARSGEDDKYVAAAKKYLDKLNLPAVSDKSEFICSVPASIPYPFEHTTTVADGAPVILDYRMIARIQPNFERMRDTGTITQEVYDAFAVLAAMEQSPYDVRVLASRPLIGRDDLPFELRRWIVMQHVLLCGSLNLAGEMESTAKDWLRAFPTDWESLSNAWKRERWDEPNVNVALRLYLVHVYSHVVSDAFAWTPAERAQRIAMQLHGLVEFEDYTDLYALTAILYCMDQRDSAASDDSSAEDYAILAAIAKRLDEAAKAPPTLVPRRGVMSIRALRAMVEPHLAIAQAKHATANAK